MSQHANTVNRLWLITLNEWLRTLDYYCNEISSLKKDLHPLVQAKTNEAIAGQATYFQQQFARHLEEMATLKQHIEQDKDAIRSSSAPGKISYEYMKKGSEMIRHEEQQMNDLKLRYDQFRMNHPYDDR